jgi:hypothetical protein
MEYFILNEYGELQYTSNQQQQLINEFYKKKI